MNFVFISKIGNALFGKLATYIVITQKHLHYRSKKTMRHPQNKRLGFGSVLINGVVPKLLKQNKKKSLMAVFLDIYLEWLKIHQIPKMDYINGHIHKTSPDIPIMAETWLSSLPTTSDCHIIFRCDRKSKTLSLYMSCHYPLYPKNINILLWIYVLVMTLMLSLQEFIALPLLILMLWMTLVRSL